MTPKEKATQLFLECPLIEYGDDNGVVNNELGIKATKDVLKFIIYELMKEAPNECKIYKDIVNDTYIYCTQNEYYIQVIKEIEKI